MAQHNLKQIIKQEYIKCAQDPVYFMKKYCWIQHPTRGRVQFNLYKFQEGTLNLLNKNDRSIILKSRQLGISTLSAGIALSFWNNIICKAIPADNVEIPNCLDLSIILLSCLLSKFKTFS